MSQRTTIFRIDGSKIRKDSRGGICVPATPTRTGIFIYRNPDGSQRRELRLAEEVFKKDSLDSLASAPVTVGHPKEPVTNSNWKKYAVGQVAEQVTHDDTHVCTSVYVNDAEPVSGVESGQLVELSCGYNCDLDETPGVFDGQNYDAIQRNIQYNHLALLPAGRARAGSTARLHTDAVDEEGLVLDATETIAEKKDNIYCEVERMEFEKLYKEAQEALAAEKAKVAAEKARADAAEAEVKTLKARADAAEAEVAKVGEKVSAAVKLRQDAMSVLGDAKLPESDHAVRLAVITKHQPDFKFDEKEHTPDYMRAAYDLSLGYLKKASLAEVQRVQAAGQGQPGERSDAGEKDPIEEARAAQNKRFLEKLQTQGVS